MAEATCLDCGGGPILGTGSQRRCRVCYNAYCRSRPSQRRRVKGRAEWPEPHTRDGRLLCLFCGWTFDPESGRSLRYCSTECRQSLHNLRHPHATIGVAKSPSWSALYLTVCPCGKPFGAPSHKFTRCESCRGGAAKRRRAIRRGARVDGSGKEVTLTYIAARDGWRCHICGKKVNPRHKYPHLRSPALDHLVPLAAPETEHSTRNVRLAHLSCNASRGARGAAQLLLLG